MIDINLLDEIIRKYNSFVLTTHVNPDADAIGSEIAFSLLLKNFGKEVKIINHSLTPYNLLFLDKENIIEKFEPSAHSSVIENFDVIFCLDLNNLSRTVSMLNAISNSKAKKIYIDHHQSPDDSADLYFIDTDASATTEIIFHYILKKHNKLLVKEIAEPIYAGIMTDTGSFRFERTTAELHRIIALLIEAGVNPVEIYNNIYDQSKLSKIRLLSRTLNTLTLLNSNRIGYMIITQKDLVETEAEESDTDNFVNYNLSIEGVELGILFIELKNGFKVSFRSKGDVRADLIAKSLGGGGHKNASGARFYDKQLNDETINNILNFALEFLNSDGVKNA